MSSCVSWIPELVPAFGAGTPVVQTVQLERGDRVLFCTDGVVEERLAGGEQFGEERLRDLIEQMTAADLTCAKSVRRLSHALMAARSGRTSRTAVPAPAPAGTRSSRRTW